MPAISVVICTHNRDYYLGDALDSALDQDFDDYDLVVVDNGSTDNTRQVVEQRLPHHSRLRYVYEAELGLNVARNRGQQETRSPLIVYFDDDAVAPRGWLTALYDAFQDNEQLGAAGGKVDLIWPDGFTRPQWLSDNLAVNLGFYDLGDKSHLISDPGLTPRGLNYAIRRSALDKIGGFSKNLDRVGNNLLSNGDLYMTELVLNAGYQVAYLVEAKVQHRVSEERVQQKWYFKRGWWQGISECYREQLAGRAGWGQIPRGLERIVRGVYHATIKYRHDPQKSFDNWIYAYSQFGYLRATLIWLFTRKGVNTNA
jgi:glycosyltransferase involved in cell wall biosynthesis